MFFIEKAKKLRLWLLLGKHYFFFETYMYMQLDFLNKFHDKKITLYTFI